MPIIVDSVQTGRFYNQAGTREFAPCTAWVNFNGTGTVAIRDSLNVSSITDNGVGDYTVNFAQAMDNTDFAISTDGRGETDQAFLIDQSFATPRTLSTVRVVCITAGTGSTRDLSVASVQVFGGITL